MSTSCHLWLSTTNPPTVADREVTRTDVEVGGAVSPIEELSEPTTEAEKDLIDAFLGLGLAIEEMRKEVQQTRQLLQAAETTEHESKGICRDEFVFECQHTDLLELLRIEEKYVEPEAADAHRRVG